MIILASKVAQPKVDQNANYQSDNLNLGIDPKNKAFMKLVKTLNSKSSEESISPEN